MARRIIEIDEDVVAVLLANIRSFDESENDVLRRLLLPAAAEASVEPTRLDERMPRQRRHSAGSTEETVHGLMRAGHLQAGDFLVCEHDGRKLRAVLLEDGRLRLANDENPYASPSAALKAAFGHDADAWATWRHVASRHTLAELQELQAA